MSQGEQQYHDTRARIEQGHVKYREKLRAEGKLFVRDRLKLLLDPGTEFQEDWLFARNQEADTPADGVVTGVGTVGGRTVCLMANDYTVKAGSWGEKTVLKIVRIQEKAAAVGFDWPTPEGPLAKVREETEEVARAVTGDTTPELAREIGDLLFAVVNLSRKLGVDPERELRGTMHRFRERFVHIEKRLAETGRSPSQSDLQEMDALWEEAKRLARAPAPTPDGAGAPARENA